MLLHCTFQNVFITTLRKHCNKIKACHDSTYISTYIYTCICCNKIHYRKKNHQYLKVSFNAEFLILKKYDGLIKVTNRLISDN